MFKDSQKGFTLLEVLAALAISSILLIAGAELASTKVQDIKDQNAAQYQSMFNSAAVRYIEANSGAIQANTSVTLTSPLKVNFLTIKNAGFIPTAFATAVSNPYNQVPCLFVYKNPADPSEIKGFVVTESGQRIPEGRGPQIASLIGVSGGYIADSTPTTASGAYGKWTNPVPNDSCSGTRATSGHVASQLYIDSGNLTQNFLYRSAVPGNPEANTMNTPLIMSAIFAEGDNCSNVGAIARDANSNLLTCFGSPGKYKTQGSRFWKDPVDTKTALNALPCDSAKVGEIRVVKTPSAGSGQRAYSCNGTAWDALSVDDNGNLNVPNNITAREVTAGFKDLSKSIVDSVVLLNGESVAKPQCKTGLIPQIFLFPSTFAIGPTAKPIQAVEAYAVDQGATWSANLRILVDSGFVSPAGTYGQMVAFLKCS